MPIRSPPTARTAISSKEKGIQKTSHERTAETQGNRIVEYHSPIDTENLAANIKTARIKSTISLALILNRLAELVEDDVAEADEQAHESEEQEEWPCYYIQWHKDK